MRLGLIFVCGSASAAAAGWALTSSKCHGEVVVALLRAGHEPQQIGADVQASQSGCDHAVPHFRLFDQLARLCNGSLVSETAAWGLGS